MPRRTPITKHQRYQSDLTKNTCQQKMRYSNELSARRAADLKNLEQTDLNLSVYQCNVCGGWHLTRQNRAR